MNLRYAQELAAKYKSMLEPYCERIEIAGSIRREKPECKDVELVVIPRGRDLVYYKSTVEQWVKIKGDAIGRYTKRKLQEGYYLDIFRATPENWGNILLIRTGDSMFSQYFVGTFIKKKGYTHEDGYLRKDGLRVPVYSEGDFFKMMGVGYLPPTARTIENLRNG